MYRQTFNIIDVKTGETELVVHSHPMSALRRMLADKLHVKMKEIAVVEKERLTEEDKKYGGVFIVHGLISKARLYKILNYNELMNKIGGKYEGYEN